MAQQLNVPWQTDKHTTKDGTKIRYGLYAQNPKEVKRYVVFVNGHGEYIEKYHYLPTDLLKNEEWGFLTWDHRGQGESDGNPRLHVESYEELASDAGELVKRFVEDKPLILVAHSMGGLVSLYATMKGYIKPRKLVISAPLLGVKNPIPPSVARTMAKIAAKLGMHRAYFQKKLAKKKFENNLFTYSQERFEARYRSPYSIEGITFGWIAATLDAIDFVNHPTNLAQLATHTKILVGDDERLVDPVAIREWVDKAQKKSRAKVTYIEMPQTRHEIFNEAPAGYNYALELTRKYMEQI